MDNRLKGMSLPIETIVIIVVSILILVIVILFFKGSFNQPARDIIVEGNLRGECHNWSIISVYEYDFNNYVNNDYPELQKRYPKTEEGAAKARKFCIGHE